MLQRRPKKQSKITSLKLELKAIDYTVKQLQQIKGQANIGNRINDLITLRNQILQEKADELIQITRENRKVA